MSELKRLLQGVEVEWKALGKYIDYLQPTKYLVRNENYSNDFKTPVLTAGKTFILGYTDELDGIYKASYKPAIIFDDFTTANKWVDFDFKAKSSAMKILIPKDDSKIILKYFFYCLNTIPSDLVPGDHKRQWISKYANKTIPIPCPDQPEKSLKIQEEIVRTLDSLSEETNKLTTALQNELNSHQKRYQYYREELFKFEGKEVEWKKISEIGKFQRGKRFVRNDMISDGVPCIHYGEMYTHYGISAVESKSYLSKDLVLSKKLRVAEKGDVIIVAAGETVEDIGKGTAWLGEESVVTHDACFSYKSPIHPVYFAYFTRTNLYHDQIKRNISSGKISAINEKGFSSVLIPVPSMEEQKSIVKILNELDSTTQSITTEIKKEIGLRNKQYEYYRDQLLSFPK